MTMPRRQLVDVAVTRYYHVCAHHNHSCIVSFRQACMVSFRQACMERRGGPASVTEFIGMQARSSHGWTEAARGGCGVVESR